MKLLTVSLIFTTTIYIAMGQMEYMEKPGSCPPALPIQFCGRSCYVDAHCAGIGKCCPTQCGGAICSMPVTTRQSIRTEKPGLCPSSPTGRWVCSSTCNGDYDCKGSFKCCRNRCGALACQKPEIEVIDPDESTVMPITSRILNDYEATPYPYVYNYNN